jgi:putative photosynthetic complex assembly protein 2
MNALFPISMFAGVALSWTEATTALDPAATAFLVVGSSLMFALTALAMVEHVFMILPLPDTALWRWALPAAGKGENAS